MVSQLYGFGVILNTGPMEMFAGGFNVRFRGIADISPLGQLDTMADDFAALIPELPNWNDGAGIEPQAWIECVGNYELVTGYSLIFWPRFVQFEGYVLRHGFSVQSLRGFEEATKGNRSAIERVMNQVPVASIHCHVEPTEAQLRYLGRTLKQIWEVKLRDDFPNLRFRVEFNDEPGFIEDEYEVTFWQTV